MLSAKSDTVDVVVGLELGADDYVDQTLRDARARRPGPGGLRRAAAVTEEPVLMRGDLEIDPAAFVARSTARRST